MVKQLQHSSVCWLKRLCMRCAILQHLVGARICCCCDDTLVRLHALLVLTERAHVSTTNNSILQEAVVTLSCQLL
jgi:hypothetical protein